ncbi:MAG: helicase-exonuclease AddAB subunit AddA [Peptococcaceae bacterium]|nr:helicase-exonuclease AddAB subunit AddA [Peptococcaceae bacterium]
MTGKWTGEQMEAISARGCNLLVSAAAGAGKTAVLVERILGRIMDEHHPVDIDRLLVVTFTNAAAAEMRERIASAISSELRERGDSGRLSLQPVLLNRARISTIHSFCMDVIKQYYYRIGLDPGFRIADETEAAMLKFDVLEEMLEALYSGGMEVDGFSGLAECYGGDLDDSALMQLVIKVYDFSRSNPDPSGWLERMAAKFSPAGNPEDALRDLAAVVLSGVAGSLEDVSAEIERALSICRKPGGPMTYASVMEEDLALVRDLAESCARGWDEACRSFAGVRFSILKRAGSGVDEGLKEQVAAIRSRAKKKIKTLGDTFLARPLAEHAADMERAAPVMRSLAGMAAGFAERYRLAKASRGLVDFGDLEHYCLQILADRDRDGELKPSEAALELREQFEEVLVDEYQDINPVQEAIIKLVSRSHDAQNLFMVGDVKQSIYRFRLADPNLFLEKYREYSEPAGGKGRLVRLSRNFRSRREIIDAVNYIFRLVMVGEAAELDYGPEAELVFGAGMYGREERVFHDRRVELHLLDRSRPEPEEDPGEENFAPEEIREEPSEDDFSDGEDPGAVQAEARLAAGRIRALIDSGFEVYDSALNAFRPARYSDVAVLMRATRGRSDVFVDELRGYGIPAYAEPDTGYFQSTEIETMVSLLKLLDNPRQDIPLAAVLRSPVAGLGCEELAQLRMTQRTGDLWDAVVAASGQAEGETARKLSRFLTSLERWRELGRRAAMTDLIWTIYRETGYYRFAGAMPGGAQRQANLRALHHWAGQYEATNFRGIFSFLRFIDRMREKGEDPGRARTLGENENVVRIMSIHKSKGLEFPVVVVSGLGTKFNLRDLDSEILLHRELGFGPWIIDPEARVAYPTLARLAVREKLRREALAEEMRILYVAMTRAREKLILTGVTADLRKSAARWSRNVHRGLTAADVLNAGSFLDWLGPALARHPDGGPLREGHTAGGALASGSGEGEGSRWLISVGKTGVLGQTETAGEDWADPAAGEIAEKISRGEIIESAGKYAAEVGRRLSWVYPAREAAGMPAKATVTGLGEAAGANPAAEEEGESSGNLSGDGFRRLSCLKPAYARPVFMAGKRDLTAAERGVAVHVVMRHLDLGGNLAPEGIAGQVIRMVERELITGDQAAAVDCRRVAEFFRSVPGRRVLAAGTVKREIPFSLAVPAGELYPGLEDRDSGERVLVQGVVDCLADEGDGYLLIDYKTGGHDGEDPGRLARRYRSQIDWYARAVETLTGRPVKDRYLYFFDLGLDLKV